MLSLFQMGLYYTSGLSVLSSLMGFSYCGCYYFFSSLIFIATADCGLCPSVILAQQMAQNVPGIVPSTIKKAIPANGGKTLALTKR